MKYAASGALLAICASFSAQADTFEVTSFLFNGQRLTIHQSTQISGSKLLQFAALPQSCTGVCVSPMIATRGVATVGELEVLEFMKFSVAPGLGLVIDARPQDQRRLGFVPSSINIPVAVMEGATAYRTQILEALGGQRTGTGWDFRNAYELVVYDTGPGTSDAPQLLRELVSFGYPASKLYFYRGGMQAWAGLGLSYSEPQS
ncbi:rhodanese-like domain-containing protein [Pseudaestuariivita atlantica]|uniref:rhodanese-like domain-containing protein n=1 Tax=Pseudaestuariivita atlantica TaxID=1317121 RepID=UPI00067BEA80|nr:rhodanese-like domain-containing protein [Pseudaestuariivita atlantica]